MGSAWFSSLYEDKQQIIFKANEKTNYHPIHLVSNRLYGSRHDKMQVCVITLIYGIRKDAGPWMKEEVGYHIKADAETPLTKDLIYDGKSFYPVLCQDLQSAEKEILIVSPFMSKVRLKKLVKVLTEPILRGVAVKAIVRPPEDLPLRDRKAVPDDAEYLMDYGIQVVFRSGFHQKFTVIDGRISWYGSVNILSFGKSEESVMRLESTEIAGELIDAMTKETETAK